MAEVFHTNRKAFPPLKPLNDPALANPNTHSDCLRPSPQITSADTETIFPTKKIPKPWGEVCRTDKRGYGLRAALGWTSKHYEEVLVSRL